ncbi:head-tail connector protein [bacterium]|nr:head-tail connector protein [bacterium]
MRTGSRDLVGTTTLVTAPLVEPVTVAEAKNHVRVDTDDDDALLRRLIEAGRLEAEAYTRRSFITTTWRLDLDGWPCGRVIHIPNPPLLAVTSVKYDDPAGDEQTLDPASYTVDAPVGPRAERGRVVLASGTSWPTTGYEPNSVRVEYTAGYGTDPTDVPDGLRHAILLMVGELYERRAIVTPGVSLAANPLAAERLLNAYRSLRW